MKTKAREAVEKIIADLRGRKGLEDAWDSIDREIQEEIMRIWERIIDEEMR